MGQKLWMVPSIEGWTALSTAPGRGIGRALALQLAEGRVSVYEHDHIIQAINEFDGERAGDMMRSHILTVKADQPAALEAESLVDDETSIPQPHRFPQHSEVGSSE